MTYQRNQEMRGLWAQGLPPVLSWAARMSTLSSRRRGGPQQLQGQPLAELWHSKLMARDPSCLGRSWVLTCRVGGAVPCPYTVTIHLHLNRWVPPRPGFSPEARLPQSERNPSGAKAPWPTSPLEAHPSVPWNHWQTPVPSLGHCILKQLVQPGTTWWLFPGLHLQDLYA